MTDQAKLSPRLDTEIPPLKAKCKHPYLLFYLAAFFIPAVTMWLVYIALEVFPFGNNSVLVLDLNGQYVYFFEDLRNKLTSGGSLIYTWSRALGGENMGIFAYYLSSPFSLLTVLFPKSMITEALLTMILCKIGSSGLTMAYYLKSTRPTNRLTVLTFSTMYALSAYAVVQAHNTMWIDAVIFLPLLMLGVERLIARRGFILYVAALAYTCLSNFYIGYMMCLFSACYFFYWYLAHGKNSENNLYEESFHFAKSLGRMILYSAVGVGIACVILIPAYYSLQFGKNEFSNPNFAFTQQFDFLDMVAKFYPGSYDTVRPEGLPFLYCGTLTLIFLPVYFISREISAREKIATGCLLAFMAVCFNGSTLDLIWHGFQRPNWLNYRYSFAVCFIMVVCAYRAFSNLTRVKMKTLAVSAIFWVSMILIIQKQDYEWLDDFQCVWFSVLMIGVMLCCVHAVRKWNPQSTGSSVLLIAVIFELFANALFCTMNLDADVVISSRDSYVNYFDRVTPGIEALKKYDADNFGSVFYRMEKTTHRKTNDAMTLGIYGITNSTSTLNTSVINMLADMGYASRSHWSKYLGGTPVSDSLLGIKYVLRESRPADTTRELVVTDDENSTYGYYNPYALSLCFASDSAVYDFKFDDYGNPFDYLNALCNAILGDDSMGELFVHVPHTVDVEGMTKSYASGYIKYTPISTSKAGELNLEFTAPEEAHGQELFMYIPSDYPWECSLMINSYPDGTYFDGENHRVMSLGMVLDNNRDFVVTLSPTKEKMYLNTGDRYFFYMNTEVYTRIMEKLAEGNMNITEFSDTDIRGTITVPDGMETLFTSIPYDEGWHVLVDGQPVEIHKTANCLLAADITSGEHSVELYYMPTCYVVGLSISVLSLGVFAVLIVYSQSKRRRRAAETKRAFEEAMHPDYEATLSADRDFTETGE